MNTQIAVIFVSLQPNISCFKPLLHTPSRLTDDSFFFHFHPQLSKHWKVAKRFVEWRSVRQYGYYSGSIFLPSIARGKRGKKPASYFCFEKAGFLRWYLNPIFLERDFLTDWKNSGLFGRLKVIKSFLLWFSLLSSAKDFAVSVCLYWQIVLVVPCS